MTVFNLQLPSALWDSLSVCNSRCHVVPLKILPTLTCYELSSLLRKACHAACILLTCIVIKVMNMPLNTLLNLPLFLCRIPCDRVRMGQGGVGSGCSPGG